MPSYGQLKGLQADQVLSGALRRTERTNTGVLVPSCALNSDHVEEKAERKSR